MPFPCHKPVRSEKKNANVLIEYVISVITTTTHTATLWARSEGPRRKLRCEATSKLIYQQWKSCLDRQPFRFTVSTFACSYTNLGTVNRDWLVTYPSWLLPLCDCPDLQRWAGSRVSHGLQGWKLPQVIQPGRYGDSLRWPRPLWTALRSL